MADAAIVAPQAVGLLVLSGVATGLSWLLYYRALQLAPASLVAPIDKLSVVFAILLAVVFLGEAFTLKLVVGGSRIVIGALLLVWPRAGRTTNGVCERNIPRQQRRARVTIQTNKPWLGQLVV